MSAQDTRTTEVWDPLVRIFHWSLVFFFFLAYLTEDDWINVHSCAGYTIALLVFFRLVWGFIGSRHARFSDFLVSYRKVLLYLTQLSRGTATRYVGHNPAGAAMIVMLLISITLTVFSGMSLIATEGQGPLAQTFISSFPEDVLEEAHEFFANCTLLLVIAHIGGVLFSSLLHKENLVRAMIDGKKRKAAGETGEKIKPTIYGEQL